MNMALDLGPHAAFIWAAYAVSTFVIVALILWISSDEKRQKRILAEFEERGVTRRSSRRVKRELEEDLD
jgi:heme exporter protein D